MSQLQQGSWRRSSGFTVTSTCTRAINMLETRDEHQVSDSVSSRSVSRASRGSAWSSGRRCKSKRDRDQDCWAAPTGTAMGLSLQDPLTFRGGTNRSV